MREYGGWLASIAGAASWLAASGPCAADRAQSPDRIFAVFFASLDGGTSSGFASSGFKAPLGGGVDEPGWFVMGTDGAGYYRYRTQAVPTGEVHGRSLGAALLVGHQWFIGRTVVGLFVGPEFQHHTLDPIDRGNDERGMRFGLRGQAELWSHPTEALLVQGTVVAGSAGRIWARAAAGVRVLERAFVGPEVIAYANANYNDTRLGAHATGIALGPFTFRVSGGVVLTGDGETGGYGALSGYVKY